MKNIILDENNSHNKIKIDMNDKTEFQHKAAIVTGAAMGIGAAVAKLLAERGAKILIVDRVGRRGASKLFQILKLHGGDVEFFKADVSDIQQLF
ncbi:MAG: SDR family NAD(P)-dependent oxidoreductase [Ignavibacteriales bacterium]|nr:SDR family NAD(P)-dependent oxidoreductase [Ignavibacteriales bacterium]